VATPELPSDDAIDGYPVPPGQLWAISPGTGETGPSLYRIEVAVGPGPPSASEPLRSQAQITITVAP